MLVRNQHEMDNLRQHLCLQRDLLLPVSTVIRTTSQPLAGQCQMWKHGNSES